MSGSSVRCAACAFEGTEHRGQLRLRTVEGFDEATYLEGIRGTIRKSRWYPLVFRALAPVLVTGPDPAARYGSDAAGGAIVIDLGAGNDRRHEDFVNIDLLPFPAVDVVTDGERLPLADGSVDVVVCIVVLEHVPDATSVIAEAHRILKPGGRFFAAVPFLQPFHAAPHDYRRWTRAGLEEDFDAFTVLESGTYGGPASSMAWIAAEFAAITLSFGSSRVRAALSLPFQALFSPLKWLDLVLRRHKDASTMASALWIEAEKPARQTQGAASSSEAT